MRSGFLLLTACSLISLGACTTTMPESKTVPDLTFAHLQPMQVRVGAVNVDNRFIPGSDPRDVSSSFPSPPDVALRRYAETRLQPAGIDGTLKFVIEDAHIYQGVEQPDNKFINWTKMDKLDVYDITVRIRLYVAHDSGSESNHAILNLHRTLSIPQRFSLAEKEQEKFKFLELLMGDVDKAVTDAVTNKMNIAGF